MKKYKVLVRGENFLFNVDGKPGKLGFYTTRFVEAKNEDDAKEVAGKAQSAKNCRAPVNST